MARVAEALATVLPAGVRLDAYDGSVAGPVDAEVRIRVKTPLALSHLISAPGQLGLARAYISGEMDIDAPSHYDVLKALSRVHMADLTLTQRFEVLRSIGREAVRWVEPPPQEVGAKRYLSGLRAHSKGRDAAAIAHHYDVSNTFYEWVLGPSMAYTCAVFPDLDATLEQAQYAKFDLVCRKLDLKPGMRLLDVGCGWGGMAMHAAEHYGVNVIAVTLSRQQAEWGRKAAAERGLTEKVDIRHSDYRDVKEIGFDAVSSIGLTEHIGIAQLSSYARFLAGKLVPQGRLLNHCITRPDDHSRAIHKRGFIGRYVFPDGELPGVGRIIKELQAAGLEVRHDENLREHYALTLKEWCANLDDHWEEALDEVGEGTARVWALYLAGSRLGFERNEIQLHQVLATKTVDGDGGMPLRPSWLS